MSDFETIAREISKAATARGMEPVEIQRLIGELKPIAFAVERARGKIDASICWALISILADQQRQRAQAERSRQPVDRPEARAPSQD